MAQNLQKSLAGDLKNVQGFGIHIIRADAKVTVKVIDKVYKTGRKVAKDFKENMRIAFDDYLPRWNYKTVPVET